MSSRAYTFYITFSVLKIKTPINNNTLYSYIITDLYQIYQAVVIYKHLALAALIVNQLNLISNHAPHTIIKVHAHTSRNQKVFYCYQTAHEPVVIVENPKNRSVDHSSCPTNCKMLRVLCDFLRSIQSACTPRHGCKSNFWLGPCTLGNGPICRNSSHRYKYVWKGKIRRAKNKENVQIQILCAIKWFHAENVFKINNDKLESWFWLNFDIRETVFKNNADVFFVW